MADLDRLIEQLNEDFKKRYGKPLVRRASDHAIIKRVQTGLHGLDRALQGGIPIGIPVIIQGRRSTGKSSLCYKIAGAAYEVTGKPVLLIYSEGPFDSQYNWAEACGLPVDNTLVFDRGLHLEDALQIVREQLRTGLYSCIIVDSLAGLRPSLEIQKKLQEAQSHGVKAVLMNRFFNSLTSFLPVDEEPPVLLFTQHLYDNPGYGGPQMSGGRGQEYMAGLIIRLVKESDITVEIREGPEASKIVTALTIKWEIIKSKVAPAVGESGTFDLYVRRGLFPPGTFSEHREAVRRAILCGLVRRRGAWYEYGEEKYHGLEAVMQAIDVAEAFEAYDNALNRVLGGHAGAEEAADNAEE